MLHFENLWLFIRKPVKINKGLSNYKLKRQMRKIVLFFLLFEKKIYFHNIILSEKYNTELCIIQL